MHLTGLEKKIDCFNKKQFFEMKSKGGSLDKATSLLTRAHNNHPNDKAIKHSLSELALRKSKKSKNELEKAKYRSDAKRLAAELIERNEQRNAHPYHTLIKIGLDELSEYLSNEDIDKSVLHRQVASVEKYISSVIQKFPGEELVYKSESDFHELLNNHSSAIKSLEKSFNINKRNPFTAIRLSKLYNKSGYIDKAFKVLRECLDYNPGEKNVNYNLACLLEKKEESLAEIKHCLRHSFTKGDSNYQAQFKFARILYLEEKFDESMEIFNYLRDKDVSLSLKNETINPINEGGKLKKFSGAIFKKEKSYCFIRRDLTQDVIFSHREHSKKTWSNLIKDQRINFFIGFNYKGPVAFDIKYEITLI